LFLVPNKNLRHPSEPFTHCFDLDERRGDHLALGKADMSLVDVVAKAEMDALERTLMGAMTHIVEHKSTDATAANAGVLQTAASTANNSDGDDSDDSAQGVGVDDDDSNNSSHSTHPQRDDTSASVKQPRKAKTLLGQSLPLPITDVDVAVLKQALKGCLVRFDISRVSGRFGNDPADFVLTLVSEEAKQRSAPTIDSQVTSQVKQRKLATDNRKVCVCIPRSLTIASRHKTETVAPSLTH
jgi:hypothetical protein